MDTPNNDLVFGVMFFCLGVAVMLILDPWFLGIAFLVIGAQRIFVAISDSSEAPSDDN